jgi:uncharacterized protein YkwD
MRKILICCFALLLFTSFANDIWAQKSKALVKPYPAGSSVKSVTNLPSAKLVALGASKVASSCTKPNGLLTAEIEAVLAAHNKARLDTNSPNLTWNCSLADWAQEWADKGVAQHREFSNYGENIFVANDSKVAATDAVNKWLAERPQWNNVTGSCAAGKTCTHYTQIVWKRTTQIGCGINRNAGGKWKVLLVCNYDPAGNNQAGAAF